MRVVQKILYLGLFFTVLVIFWLIFIQQMLDVHKQVVSINTATNRPPLIFSAQGTPQPGRAMPICFADHVYMLIDSQKSEGRVNTPLRMVFGRIINNLAL